MKTRLKLTDKQFDALDKETRRSMIYQLMFIDTPKYQYCIGANGQWWTMVRYEWQHAGEVDKKLQRSLINGYKEEISWENFISLMEVTLTWHR